MFSFFSKKKFFVPFTILIFIFLFYNSAFLVNEKEKAIVLQFGEAKKAIDRPGLFFKMPLVNSVVKYDVRYRTGPVSAKELTCADNKRIVVDAFSYFSIVDIVKFYSTVNNYNTAHMRVKTILESYMREVIGRFNLSSLLSSDRLRMMEQICLAVNVELNKYGIKVLDVRISKADLPNENSNAVCNRMRTEREQEAEKIRSEGVSEATRISSQADKEKVIALADAYKKSQIITSEGEAIAAKIYNKCYSNNIDFFKFYQSIQVYKNIFKDGKSSFIIPLPDNLLKHLNTKD